MRSAHQGILLVVSGPSGVGKGTVIGELRKDDPQIELSVSCTTRPRRTGEVDGQDYHFVSPAEFDQMRESGRLLEWARVHGTHSYGTPRQPVEVALTSGRTMILEIDCQGAKSVRDQLDEQAVLVFIAPPSWQILSERLAKRHTESPEALKERLATALREISHIDMFKYVIINDELSEAVAQLRAILIAERQLADRFDWQHLQESLLAQVQETGAPEP